MLYVESSIQNLRYNFIDCLRIRTRLKIFGPIRALFLKPRFSLARIEFPVFTYVLNVMTYLGPRFKVGRIIFLLNWQIGILPVFCLEILLLIDISIVFVNNLVSIVNVAVYKIALRIVGTNNTLNEENRFLRCFSSGEFLSCLLMISDIPFV